jgi:hypothetical protein
MVFYLGAGRAFRYKSAPDLLRHRVCGLFPAIAGACKLRTEVWSLKIADINILKSPLRPAYVSSVPKHGALRGLKIVNV